MTPSASSDANKSSADVRWINIAKGIGIFLVVVGHFYPKDSPTYWATLHSVIYEFHMPLFFVLAGYLLRESALNTYADLISKKVQRLLLPFLTAATAITVLKLSAQQFVTLEFPVSMESIQALLLCPFRSPAPLLWFVYTLFLMFCLFPIIYKVVARNVLILLIASLIAAELIHGDMFCLSALAANFPFFVIGFAANSAWLPRTIIDLDPRYGLIPIALGFLLLNIQDDVLPPDLRFTSILQGLSGALLVIYVAKQVEHLRFSGILSKMGQLSMGIYLFHTIFESAVRVTLTKILVPLIGYDVSFPIIAGAAVFVGIAIPALLEQYLLRRFRFTRLYVLGIPSRKPI